MKMNEVMNQTKLSKQTIIYYEKEGLIEAKRGENNYREYSDKDVQTLMWIKCMRAMQVSIEDIKRLQNNQYTLEECLNKQVKIMEENMRTLHETQQQIQLFKEKNMPIIPELLSLDLLINSESLGFKKTTPNISIGRPLTKKHAIKMVTLWGFYSALLTLALIAGWTKWGTAFSETPNFLIVFCVCMSLFVLAYGFGFGNMGVTYYHDMHNAIDFMEFDQNGISYCHAKSFIERIQFLLNTLNGKVLLKHVSYENIVECRIVCHEMMVKNYSSISTGHIGKFWDFYFTFSDGTTFDLIRPMILNNEIEAIKVILENKVADYKYLEKGH